jgi:hypothetical protein
MALRPIVVRTALPVLLFLMWEVAPCGATSDESVSIVAAGAHPNDPAYNSVNAFQQTLAKLGASGGGTLLVPAGDYYVQNPNLADNIDPKDARNRETLRSNALAASKLILVPARVMITGTHDAEGKPTTRIHWRTTSVPLFSFVSADHSGITDIAFVFDGTQPQFFPWSQEDFLPVVGYKSRALGGQYELSTVIYTIGSEGLRFENLSFRSSKSPPDNEHTFAFGIVSKGKTPVTVPDPRLFSTIPVGSSAPGGGLTGCVTGNVFRSLRFEDYVMGIVASGQCNPVFENITGDNRGSWYRSFDPSRETGPEIKYIGPPGHLIYLTSQNAYDVRRAAGSSAGELVVKATTRNKNVLLSHIEEGSQTLSNVNSLGTLALKNIDGGRVSGVKSHHPAGLIQVIVDAHGLVLEDLTWSVDRDICSDPSSFSCGVPIIAVVPGTDAFSETSDGIRFSRAKLHSVGAITAFRISAEDPKISLSRDITVDGLTIESQPFLQGKPNSGKSTIMLRSVNAHLTNVTYSAVVDRGAPASAQATTVVILSRSSDTTVDIQIRKAPGLTTDDAYKCVVERDVAQPARGCRIDRRFIE